jgi:hypothetical protein
MEVDACGPVQASFKSSVDADEKPPLQQHPTLLVDNAV